MKVLMVAAASVSVAAFAGDCGASSKIYCSCISCSCSFRLAHPLHDEIRLWSIQLSFQENFRYSEQLTSNGDRFGGPEHGKI